MRSKPLRTFLGIGLMAIFLGGCDGPAEESGERLDETVEETREELQEAREELEELRQELEAVTQERDQARQQLQQAEQAREQAMQEMNSLLDANAPANDQSSTESPSTSGGDAPPPNPSE